MRSSVVLGVVTIAGAIALALLGLFWQQGVADGLLLQQRLKAEGIYANGKIRAISTDGCCKYYVHVDWDHGDMMQLDHKLQVRRPYYQGLLTTAGGFVGKDVVVRYWYHDSVQAVLTAGVPDWQRLRRLSHYAFGASALFLSVGVTLVLRGQGKSR